jgi:hypothetical protein
MTGQQFGRLTVTSFWGRRGKNSYWRCRCQCGNETIARSGELRSGHTKSCGCLRAEFVDLLGQRAGRFDCRFFGAPPRGKSSWVLLALPLPVRQ